MFRRREAEMPLQIAVQDGAGVDHLGVEQGAGCQQTVEVAAVPIRPVHHRRDAEAAVQHRPKPRSRPAPWRRPVHGSSRLRPGAIGASRAGSGDAATIRPAPGYPMANALDGLRAHGALAAGCSPLDRQAHRARQPGDGRMRLYDYWRSSVGLPRPDRAAAQGHRLRAGAGQSAPGRAAHARLSGAQPAGPGAGPGRRRRHRSPSRWRSSSGWTRPIQSRRCCRRTPRRAPRCARWRCTSPARSSR